MIPEPRKLPRLHCSREWLDLKIPIDLDDSARPLFWRPGAAKGGWTLGCHGHDPPALALFVREGIGPRAPKSRMARAEFFN